MQFHQYTRDYGEPSLNGLPVKWILSRTPVTFGAREPPKVECGIPATGVQEAAFGQAENVAIAGAIRLITLLIFAVAGADSGATEKEE
jgi:hypothetical protein